jgi:hypothetical protein
MKTVNGNLEGGSGGGVVNLESRIQNPEGGGRPKQTRIPRIYTNSDGGKDPDYKEAKKTGKGCRAGSGLALRARKPGGAEYLEKITGFYAFFHDFPRFYAQIRAVFTRFYAFLRVRLIFNHRWTPMNTDSDEANHRDTEARSQCGNAGPEAAGRPNGFLLLLSASPRSLMFAYVRLF